MWKIIIAIFVIQLTKEQCSVEGCLSCPESVSECKVCDTQLNYFLSGTECLKIDKGPYFDRIRGGCTLFLPGCLECVLLSEYIMCYKCDTESGFLQSGSSCCDSNADLFPDQRGGCEACDKAIPGCTACQFDSVALLTSCQTCEQSYTISHSDQRSICCDNAIGVPDGSGGCVGCPDEGCQVCQNNGGEIQCLLCSSEYGLSGTACCKFDEDEYPDGEGGCAQCSDLFPSCSSCNYSGSTACEICEKGFFLDDDEQCISCPHGCTQCSAYGGEYCYSCDVANGFVPTIDFECCDTNNNKFPNLKESGCFQCSSLIQGCSKCEGKWGETKCTECNKEAGNELSGSICCNTNNDEYPDGLNACGSCSSVSAGCSTCIVNSGTTQCSACDSTSGFYLSGSICCNTNNDEYPDGLNACGSCSSVSAGCSTCIVNSGTTQCSACDSTSGFYLSGSICCNTNNDEYPDGLNACGSCSSVSAGCSTCIVNSGTTQCSACDSTSGFYLSGSICCNTNNDEYPDGLNACGSCSSVSAGCSTCIVNSGTTQCSACDSTSGFYLSGSICCNTNNDEYPDGLNACGSCSSVSAGCSTCIVNSGTTQCSACDSTSGFYLSGSICCNTNNDEYPDGLNACGSCSSVSAGCSTCIVNSGTTQCSACDSTSGFYLSGSICCNTNNDEYPDGLNACGSCSSVSAGCSTCIVNSGTTQCSACDSTSGFYLSGSICCNTNNDEYPDGLNACGSCSSVSAGCSTCIVNSGTTQCSACDSTSGFYLSGSICCNTNNDEYPDGLNACGSCSSVSAGCSTCIVNSGTTQCSACDSTSGFYLSGSICCNTNNDEYPDGLNACGSCSSVSAGCSTCIVNSGTTQCSACDSTSGFYLSGSICCNTNNDEYPDGLNACGSCSSVSAGCSTCIVNSGTTQCSACDSTSGFYLSGSICCNTQAGVFPDENEGCESCSEANTGCLTCNYNSVTSSADCTLCATGYTASGTICCDDALEIPDNSGGCTEPCMTGCLFCPESVEICQTCNTGAGFYLSGSICCNTNNDEYPDGLNACGSCSSVSAGCSTCIVNSGTTQCSACDSTSGFYLSGSICCNTNNDEYPDGLNACGSCSSVSAGCSTCIVNSGTTQCSACDSTSGFYLSGSICCNTNNDEYPDGLNACGSCSSVSAGCSTCIVNSGTTQCSACDSTSGFYLSGSICCNTNNDEYPDGLNACGSCSSVSAGCSTCIVNSGTTQCSACDSTSGFYLSGSICCNTNNDEYPDGLNACGSCSSVSAGCSTCIVNSGTTQCSACDSTSGFYLSGSICCNTNNDEYPDGLNACGSCSSVSAGCSTCIVNSGTTQCSACDSTSGFYLSGSICCNTNNDEYPDGLNACGSCSSVSAGCSTCIVNSGTTQCSACDSTSGFYLSGSICCNTNNDEYPDGLNACGSCSSVSAGCSTCIVNSGTTQCSACDSTSGFYLSGSICCNTSNNLFPAAHNLCTSCQVALPGCSSCSYIDQIIQCQGCEEGYSFTGVKCCDTSSDQYPAIGGQCGLCGDIVVGCSSCRYQETTQCSECEEGYALSSPTKCCLVSEEGLPDSEGGCAQCSALFPNCLSCQYSQISSVTTCSRCAPTFALVHSQCIECGDGQMVALDGLSCVSCADIHPSCSQCSSESEYRCTACTSGYFPASDGSACLISSCTHIDLDCFTCEDNTCLSCKAGYVLTAPTICTRCGVSEAVSDDGTACVGCSSIDANCYLCSNQRTCTSCLRGYALTSLTACTLCTSTQTISDDSSSCVECSFIDQHCLTCSSQRVCDSCALGHILVRVDKCQPLPCQQIDDNCATCDGVSCTSCYAGYARQDNSCMPCSYDQTVSVDGQSCVVCQQVIPDCVRCSSPSSCFQCRDDLVLMSPTLCSTCAEGQVFDGSICVPCTLLHCDVCSTPFTCKHCSQGYIYNATTNKCISTTTLSTTCGNYYEHTEDCDDGNNRSGDGCSASCVLEQGYSCYNFPGFLSLCELNCGNGQLDAGEQCDDGNMKNFDGCSSTCQTQSGYRCSGRDCSRLCGNGQVDGGQQCDDNNTISGDGCSSLCKTQVGWYCSPTCLPICGDGIKLGREQCDDGNLGKGDGCFRCFEESGWACEGSTGEKSVCSKFENFCGNGVYEWTKGERCDDGNQLEEDGCNSQCHVESGWVCDNSRIRSVCSRCGNGQADAGEECDDFNNRSFDGCSAACKLEDGFECSQYFPAVCREVPVCYDGQFDALSEGCDDGNNVNGDGCSKQCAVEEGWKCSNSIGTISHCSVIPVCGNAVLQPVNNERCDDGNSMNGDGCSTICVVEELFECTNIVGMKSVCERDYRCGNGRHEVENREECDDGNEASFDGCSGCRIQPGWRCIVRRGQSICALAAQSPPLTPSADVTVCGDGRKEADEECDDKNSNSFDGCSSLCRVQGLFECLGQEGQKSACRRICGNARIDQQEECDDGNGISGDGCTSDCRVEKGFSCQGYSCVSLCGNAGVDLSFHEECDDGNRRSGDGCSSACQVQAGWECTILFHGRSACSRACGNGKYQPSLGEECDDGNIAGGDGCFDCVIEPEWVCSQLAGTVSECKSDHVAYCMNGKYEPSNGEQCDDGNSINTDGCSNTCRSNANFFCSNILSQKSICGLVSDGTCVEGAQIPSLKLLPAETEALLQTPFANASTLSQLIPMLVKRTNGVVSTDLQPYTLAKNAFYRANLFIDWFKVDYFVSLCTGK